MQEIVIKHKSGLFSHEMCARELIFDVSPEFADTSNGLDLTGLLTANSSLFIYSHAKSSSADTTRASTLASDS